MDNKSFVQKNWDFIGLPFRLLLFDQKWLPAFSWTTLEQERINALFPHVKGRLLDIGAGNNELIHQYGNGIGVDVFDWGSGALIVKNAAALPFKDNSFDTISFLACLNHITNREQVLEEAKRLLRPKGRILITMINPILGGIGHPLWWYSEDRKRGGMQEGELSGMWSSQIISILESKGFSLVDKTKFLYWMNNLLIFKHQP